MAVSKPGQLILGVSPGVDKMGIAVMGGLNPLVAVEEAGIRTQSKAISTIVDFKELVSIEEVE